MHLTISNRSLLPTGPLMLEDQLPGQLRGNARFVIDGLLSRESRTVSYRMPRLPRGPLPRRTAAHPAHRPVPPHRRAPVVHGHQRDRRGPDRRDGCAASKPPRSLDVGDDAGSHSIGVRGADDASTREYRTGDDLRKIHWRSSARTGALMVRQEERPWQGQMTVLLDLRRNAHVEGRRRRPRPSDERLRSSLEWAISAAATIASYGDRRRAARSA